MLVVTIWLQLCMSYSSSCRRHLHHPCFNRIQNGGILEPAYVDRTGKWPLSKCCITSSTLFSLNSDS